MDNMVTETIAARQQRIILTSAAEPEVTYQIGADAQVHIISIIAADTVSRRCAELGEHASVHWSTIVLGGNVQQEIVTRHDGRGATSQHDGLFFGMNHDHFALNFWSEHRAEETTGHIVVHGVLFENAYTDFKGNVRILATGRHTTASLTEHTLLLGQRARSDSVPQLEIANNEVQAQHSSSTTRVDEEQLFYLASRGLEHAEAQRLIVRGFLNDIIDRVPDASVQESIRRDIETKLTYVA